MGRPGSGILSSPAVIARFIAVIHLGSPPIIGWSSSITLPHHHILVVFLDRLVIHLIPALLAGLPVEPATTALRETALLPVKTRGILLVCSISIVVRVGGYSTSTTTPSHGGWGSLVLRRKGPQASVTVRSPLPGTSLLVADLGIYKLSSSSEVSGSA